MDHNKKASPFLVALVFFLALLGIAYYMPRVISHKVIPMPKPIVRNEPVTAPIVEEETPPAETSYDYLFVETQESKTSNIVGYFGSGAFAWYVPGWLVQNWKSTLPSTSESLLFAPKVRANEDFSDILLLVTPSSEAYNAATLYMQESKPANGSEIVIKEVLLNKHADGMLSIQMETDTRIYHIQKTRYDWTTDIYYMDGNGKTLYVKFEARSDIFSQFSSKIRDLVEGIGELKAPQG